MADPRSPLARLSRPGQWGVLLAASIALAALLKLAGLPAALMLGPMMAAIFVGVGGGTIRVHDFAQNAAQVVIGCMIAGTITPAIIGTVLKEWPLCLGVVVATVAASSLLGWGLGRLRVIPGTTAVWGLSPGGASVMVLMAEEFGADGRLVAFMQYLRVVCVAGVAAVIARFWVEPSGAAVHQTVWFPPVHWLNFAATIAVAGFGAALARVSRMPAGLIFGPLVLGAALHATGVVAIELPPCLLVTSFAIIGWRIGLAFTRPILAHAARTLPQTLMSIFALIAFCGGLAVVLSAALGVDPLTAYLATSPGGLDSAAVIAASSHVDLSFIMALQTLRAVIVMQLGPAIARFVARRLQQQTAASEEPAPSVSESPSEGAHPDRSPAPGALSAGS
ncbi:AbrB family transcriptional regulator [Fimbriiglobus ruber]|uniref:Ammonia monooxygenase n=1 Tax=Fimbriiglobus ruber TaxID=1908690 RepID=A0A225DGQ5_9BACT|nr:AbrB family transcriptional regulator [Fimbriiglobus ruber]OWK36556.1 ammonia monooxygenase [Fimbriiglobus ruber]